MERPAEVAEPGRPALPLTCSLQPVRPPALRPARQDTPPKRHLITPVPGQLESQNPRRGHNPGKIRREKGPSIPAPKWGYHGLRPIRFPEGKPSSIFILSLITCTVTHFIAAFKSSCFLNLISFYVIILGKLSVCCASRIFY